MATEDVFTNFFESNYISGVNQRIVREYMQKTMRKVAQTTIDYNRAIMEFVLKHIKTDLDKLTNDDIEDYQAALDNWKCAERKARKDGRNRKDSAKTGAAVANTTKNQYVVGFKRFLRWYGKRHDKTYLDLADSLEKYKKPKGKTPSDLLTKEEILKIIDAADELRDKAIIAVLAESGCRIGELLSCRIKDVERTPEGAHITFPEGKTGPRTVLITYMAVHVFRWLEVHPAKNNIDAPLCSTKMLRKSKKTGERAYRAINYQTCCGILQDAVVKAGITKRVHPHLFRHTRATMLAQSLNEPMLRKYLGWAPGSNMPAVYLHISNADADLAIRELYGLTDKKTEKGFQVGKCPRCQAVVPVESQYCGTCGMPLTKDAEKDTNTATQEIMQLITSDPELMTKLAAALQKQQ